MFTEKNLMFMYCISPVHMGAGTSLGVIDNPIQRERHTEHPLFAGSGIKGALRDEAKGSGLEDSKIDKIFGPESDGAEHAGAISFSDGQIVAFPVRCLKEGFVYITSDLAINRLGRLLDVTGIDGQKNWTLPSIGDNEAIVLDDTLLSEGKLILETYEFINATNGNNSFKDIASWISKNVLPNETSFEFFREKLKNHLVLLSETQFSFFVRNATIVEPHVRIDDVSGTAEDGGLFFCENVPPESVFVSVVMASEERKKKGDEQPGNMSARKILEEVKNALNGQLIQIGGDATTGRGQVLINFVGKSDKEETGNENS